MAGRQCLDLVRDLIGERGAYYARVAGGVAFASTRYGPCSTAASFRVSLNTGALPAYLSFGYLPGPETLVQGVFELLPGQHLIFRGDGPPRRAH